MIRPASTVCLLRPAEEGMEVLMVRRSTASAFVGGAYVSGGAIDDDDRSDLARRAVTGVDDPEMFPWAAAALREAAEEAGVLVMPIRIRLCEICTGPTCIEGSLRQNRHWTAVDWPTYRTGSPPPANPAASIPGSSSPKLQPGRKRKPMNMK